MVLYIMISFRIEIARQGGWGHSSWSLPPVPFLVPDPPTRGTSCHPAQPAPSSGGAKPYKVNPLSWLGKMQAEHGNTGGLWTAHVIKSIKRKMKMIEVVTGEVSSLGCDTSGVFKDQVYQGS